MHRLAPFILLAACHGGSAALSPGEMVDDPAAVVRSCVGLPSVAVELGEMSIVPDRILRVSVTYFGGCETHTFAACWDGSISKTNPSTISIGLAHDDHQDACDGVITRDLFVDISDTPENFGGPQRIDNTSIRLTEQR